MRILVVIQDHHLDLIKINQELVLFPKALTIITSSLNLEDVFLSNFPP